MSLLLDNPYVAELSASRQRLKRLKDNYARRSAQKRGRGEQGAEQQAAPGPEAALAEEEQKSSRAAQQLVARCLLDPAVHYSPRQCQPAQKGASPWPQVFEYCCLIAHC